MTDREWEELDDRIRGVFLARLRQVAAMFASDLKRVLSVPVPPGRPRATPGAPPRRDTGHLRRSVAYRVDAEAMTAVVGTNVLYGAIHEFAKPPRSHPWFHPTWDRNYPRYVAIMLRDIREGL